VVRLFLEQLITHPAPHFLCIAYNKQKILRYAHPSILLILWYMTVDLEHTIRRQFSQTYKRERERENNSNKKLKQ